MKRLFGGLMALMAMASGEGAVMQTPLRLEHEVLPIFPAPLTAQGVSSGKVSVALSVNAEGRVEDCLAVACTNPLFAETAVAAVRRWTFEPARIGGQPVGSTTRVEIIFRTEGTAVVELDASQAVARWIDRVVPLDTGFHAWGLAELDRVPRRLVTVAPVYPEALAERGRRGTVAVAFYIDPSGNVRLPSVEPGGDPELGVLALDAIRRWKFEPPTRHGRPALARAVQLFHFDPRTGDAASPAAGAKQG